MKEMTHRVIDPISLDGKWDFKVDWKSEGRDSRWFSPACETDWESIQVPTCWEHEGYDKQFCGPMWYRKAFSLPSLEHDDQRVLLRFQAVNFFCEVWVNNTRVGQHEGGWTPFEFDITDYCLADTPNTLVVAVEKQGGRFPAGEVLTGFLPDIAFIWGGVWRSVSLAVVEPCRIDTLRLDPNVATKTLTVNGTLSASPTYPQQEIRLRFSVYRNEALLRQTERTLRIEDRSFSEAIRLDDIRLWNIDAPHLDVLRIEQFNAAGQCVNRYERKFGWRTIEVIDGKFFFNKQPLLLRGIIHWGWYPDRVIPNPTVDEIKREILSLKSLGFNIIKHCVYVPDEAYYAACDELGMLQWIELPMWKPDITREFMRRACDEYERIVSVTAQHPSMIIHSLGCEVDHFAYQDRKALYDIVARLAPRCLVNDIGGANSEAGGEFNNVGDDSTATTAVMQDNHFETERHYLRDILNNFARPSSTGKAWLLGEFCGADTFRNLIEIRQRIGEQFWLKTNPEENPILRRWDLPITRFESVVAEHKLEARLDELVGYSYTQALQERKFFTEFARTYEPLNGYLYCAIRDVAQTTPGIFDDFGQVKYDGKSFRAFNDDVALLVDFRNSLYYLGIGSLQIPRVDDYYNYWEGSAVPADVLISNYSARDLSGDLTCELCIPGEQEGGRQYLRNVRCASGTVSNVGSVNLSCGTVRGPVQATLSACLDTASGCYENQWPIFIYPKPEPITAKVVLRGFENARIGTTIGVLNGLVDVRGALTEPGDFTDMAYLGRDAEPADDAILATTVLTKQSIDWVEQGGRMIFFASPNNCDFVEHVDFWRQLPLIDTAHPIMRDFPFAGYFDQQFFSLATAHGIAAVKGKGRSHPLLTGIGLRDFRVLNYLLEMRIGRGTLLVTTLNFFAGCGMQAHNLRENVAGRFLFHNMVRYLVAGTGYNTSVQYTYSADECMREFPF